jgi:DNA-3-methyladenine glycosylase
MASPILRQPGLREPRNSDSVAPALDRSFFARSVHVVAPELVGAMLLYRGVGGIIVEVEAYHHTDPAAHSYRGRTPRNAVMFGPPGYAYVYRSYGIHWCLNFVCEPKGSAAAVLIRALEPTAGVERMRARRGRIGERAARDLDLCSGPGKLTQALGIWLDRNGASLTDGPVRIGGRPAGWESPEVLVGPRVGINVAVELPWRFCVAGNAHVSRPRPLAWPAARTAAGALATS